MIVSVAWKEYREHRSFWVVLAVLTAAVVPVMGQVFAPGSPWAPTNDGLVLAVIGAAVMTGMYGLVCGGMMIAGERESSAVPFLDNLPASRAELWWSKLLVGLVLTGLHALVTIAAVRLAGLDEQAHLPFWWPLGFAGVALESFCWGLCLSAACRTVLAAIAIAALLPIIGVWTVCTGMLIMVPPMLIGFRLMMMAGALGVSLALFTNRDWEKRFSLGLAPPRGEAAPRRAPLAWEAVLSVSLRQGRVEMAVCFALAVAAGLALPAATLPIWEFATLVIGAICGAAVFSGEQAERANRLFGDQRLPVGRVWAWKTGLWLATALLATGVMALAGALRFATPSGVPVANELEPALEMFLGGESGPRLAAGTAALALVGLLTGFGFGQFSSLIWRKGAVAVVVSVMGGAGAVCLWVPSLIAGGTPPWVLLVMPLVLLAACRLSQWAWAAERLHSRRPMVGLIGGGVGLGLLWAAGVFVYRAQEPPAGEEPFDVAGFRASLNRQGEEKTDQLLAKALSASQEQQRKAEEKQVPPAAAGQDAAGQDRDRPLLERARERRLKALDAVLERGWEGDKTDLPKYLDRVFAGDAAKLFRAATDQEPVRLFDPRLSSRTMPELDGYRTVAVLLSARALQLQARGQQDEGLELLLTALALSRHLQYLAPPVVYRAALETEAVALDGLGHWLHGVGPRADLVGQARDGLARHETLAPSVIDTLKIQCVNILRGLEDSGVLPEVSADSLGLRRLDNETLGVVVVTPWERARARRIVNAVYAGRLRAAEAGFVPAPTAVKPADPGKALLGDWQAADTAPEVKERLSDLLTRSWLRGYLARSEELQRAALMHLTRIRGARLQAALLHYEQTQGKPAASLDDLAAEAPVDPFGGRAFHYRLSQGERLLWPKADGDKLVGRVKREVDEGVGILWSVGPDGVDHGGLRQWDKSDTPDAASDLIFLVPRAMGK